MAARLIKSGTRPGAAVNQLRAMMEASDAKRDNRFRDRWHEIPRLVDSAVEKYARPQEAAPANAATIRIVKGEIARMVDEAEAALLAVADAAPIMVRAGMLVQPIVDLLPASHGRMTEVVLLRVVDRSQPGLPAQQACRRLRAVRRPQLRNGWRSIRRPRSQPSCWKRAAGSFPRWPASSPRRRCGPMAPFSISPATIRRRSSGIAPDSQLVLPPLSAASDTRAGRAGAEAA